MQIDPMARVGMDVGFKGPRGRERLGHGAGDRHRDRGSRRLLRGAVAAAEDEVLFWEERGGVSRAV